MVVTGIGQCSLDYLALVDAYPLIDTKEEVLEWYEQGGGPVATALVTLSSLGIRCRFYGVVGDDDAGEKIRQSLMGEGIDAAGLIKRENSTSQVAFIAVEKKTAKRTIFWKRPSGDALTVEEMKNAFFGRSDFLLLDGLMKDVSLYAAARAREMNIPVMLDAGRMRPGMPELAKLSDYVVASQEFAKDLGLELTEESLRRERQKLGTSVFTVTLGENGSITASEDETFRSAAFAVDAADTTGAGDVFHGGYIYGILKGWGLRDSVTFASAMAAIKCGRIGGRAGIPRLNEVMEFLGKRGYAM
jgi:ribokinase